jgi:hypothetical protein
MDFFNIGGIFFLLKIACLLFALFVISFALRTFAPVFKIVLWMFGFVPGQQPGEIAMGIAHGLRMLAWGLVIAFVLWNYVL